MRYSFSTKKKSIDKPTLQVCEVFLLCIIYFPVIMAYKAAVVEFRPDNTNENRIQNNLDGYSAVLQSLGRGAVDIIVFPEAGLLGLSASINTRNAIHPYLEQIPEPNQDMSQSINPCNDSDYINDSILHQLSCFARNFNTVIVANMGEVQNCSGVKGCPNDGRYQYNTNVVFESDGRLIAKYRKQNLYDPEKLLYDAGTTDSCVTFATSFGIKFGTMTCFDLLYKNPGDCLVNKEHIKHVVLPTAWGNNYPFYMSIVVQQAWSMKHRINFLAANVQYVSYRGHSSKVTYTSSGSGIYSSGYAEKYFISDPSFSPASGRVLVADLPDDPSPPTTNRSHSEGDINNVNGIKARTSKYLKYEFLSGNSSTIIIQVEAKYYDNTIKINSELTCTLKYAIKSAGSEEAYAVGAYLGVNPRDHSFGYAVCDLVKCKSADIKDCGLPVSAYTAETVSAPFISLEVSLVVVNLMCMQAH
jgi:pantetheine hydrolase